jgi:hypothetical protein
LQQSHTHLANSEKLSVRVCSPLRGSALGGAPSPLACAPLSRSADGARRAPGGSAGGIPAAAAVGI